MKRSWIISVAGLLAGASACAPAQAEIKIGVVNAARLLQESPQAKAVQDALRSEFAPKQRELAAFQATLKAKQEKYEKDGATMSAEQRTKTEKELRDGNRDAESLNKVAQRAAGRLLGQKYRRQPVLLSAIVVL